MRSVMGLCGAFVIAAMLLAAHWIHVPWESLVTVGLVLGCLAWNVLMLTLPWNLYFQAKSVLFEMQRARERGIAVRPDRQAEALRVQRRMLRFSVALHIGSAALAAAATLVSHGRWGYVFSGWYLLSGFFRPGVEYYRYLRQRLGHLVAEVTFPRDDVKAMQAEVKRLSAQAIASAKAEAKLGDRIDALQLAGDTRHRQLELRFVSLARTFEETVDRLTDNQQIIGGIKAFLRLIQQDSVAAGGAAPRTG